MKNLIFIEGVSGAGKSTMTLKLCEKLRKSGYTAVYHLEGDIKSPVDSFWNAYLIKTEYDNVCAIYPDFSYELSKNSINFNDYVLVRYQDFDRRYYSPELYEYLKAREFCYNPVNPLPHIKYTEIFFGLWRRFTESKQTVRDFVILDGSFLYHQMNDLIRNYDASEKDIIRHLIKLLRAVQSLNPILFYLTSKDTGRRLLKVWKDRGKAEPTKDELSFWTNRKDMDLRILEQLPVESHVLDISNEDWDSAVDTMLIRVTENMPMIDHYDMLIDENNDPARDPEKLKAYMDKWDGEGFIEAMRLSPEKSVLEIGVGTGRLALRVCGQCASFIGIDISPKTVERAKENLHGFKHVNLICGDFLTYPFSETFDIIYSSLTFMHMKDKVAAIQKAGHLLNPGGWFILSIDKNQQTEIDCGARRIPVFPDTPKVIRELLTEAGFIIEKQFETEFAVVFAARKD